MRITVDSNCSGAPISPLTRGINLEDLHYQMYGGIYSQLIHGESFFEPSHGEYARKYGVLDGFANTEGRIELEGNCVVLDADMYTKENSHQRNVHSVEYQQINSKSR